MKDRGGYGKEEVEEEVGNEGMESGEGDEGGVDVA